MGIYDLLRSCRDQSDLGFECLDLGSIGFSSCLKGGIDVYVNETDEGRGRDGEGFLVLESKESG